MALFAETLKRLNEVEGIVQQCNIEDEGFTSWTDFQAKRNPQQVLAPDKILLLPCVPRVILNKRYTEIMIFIL